jgi:WxL Interacting Protein, peptidoglycan binding domain
MVRAVLSLVPLTLCASIAAALVTAPPVQAAGREATFALSPMHADPSLKASRSYFVIRAKPGEVVSTSVRVSNVGGLAGTTRLYAAGATTGSTSGAVYLGRNRVARSVGAWLDLHSKRLTLAPHTSRVVTFTVRVPPSATPGDHLGGIVAENASLTNAAGKGSLQVRIRRLTIVGVEVQVPGHPAALLRISGVKAGGGRGYQYLYLHLRNDGAVTLKPAGTLVVATANGTSVARRRLSLDTFLPGTAIDYPVLLPGKVLTPGSYTATIVLSYRAIVLGYRRSPGPWRTVRATFGFTVTHEQQTQVYKGAPAAAAPDRTARASTLPWIAGSMGALILLLVAALIGIRLWLRRA